MATVYKVEVMECWDKVMTVKCKGGCMTKEYDHFLKIEDINGFTEVYESNYFEDNRTSSL